MIKLKDGSVVEMRERSGFHYPHRRRHHHLAGPRQHHRAAAKRSSDICVATADCRVAVTGTVFSVTNGVKGSRVSVIGGEVHVTPQNSPLIPVVNRREKVLHPSDQTVTSLNLEPVSVKDDIA
jgi:ferric-dicitrate binding protein FerR (iron transport regulator)